MAKVKRGWIKKAINPAHKGDFREKAERAGESTRAFAKEHAGSPGLLGKQARLAESLMGLHHGKKHSAEGRRKAMYSRSKGM